MEAAAAAPCPHEVVWNGLCTACGMRTSRLDELVHGDSSNSGAAQEGDRIAMSAGFAIRDGGQGQLSLSKEARSRLLAARKLVLVLDLDETLIHTDVVRKMCCAHHSESCQECQHWLPLDQCRKLHSEVQQLAQAGGDLKGLRPGEFHAFSLASSHAATARPYFTKLRPGVLQFLRAAAAMFELNIFTKGQGKYAAEVQRILDPDNTLFYSCVSKDECEFESKDLKHIFPCPSSMTVVIDDRDDVWELGSGSGNVLRVPPYRFWNDLRVIDRELERTNTMTQEIRLRELARFDDEDTQLSSMLQVLTSLHAQYYGGGGESSPQGDTAQLLAEQRGSILEGAVLCFSAVFDKRKHESQQELWVMATACGAVCVDKLSDEVTHVVSAKKGTAKVNRGRRMGCHVVHVSWLQTCLMHWRRFAESDFGLFEVLLRPAQTTDSISRWYSSRKTLAAAPLSPSVDGVPVAREIPRAAVGGEVLSDVEAEATGSSESESDLADELDCVLEGEGESSERDAKRVKPA